MFTQLLKPVLNRIYPCAVEEIHHTGQKERRIIDTLEPVFNQHRLVMDRKVIQLDYQVTQDFYGDRASHYQAFHQLTRITKDRGCLSHDDRVEALAMMVAYWVNSMARDTDKSAAAHRQGLLEAELKGFIRAATETMLGRREPEGDLVWSNARP